MRKDICLSITNLSDGERRLKKYVFIIITQCLIRVVVCCIQVHCTSKSRPLILNRSTTCLVTPPSSVTTSHPTTSHPRTGTFAVVGLFGPSRIAVHRLHLFLVEEIHPSNVHGGRGVPQKPAALAVDWCVQNSSGGGGQPGQVG